ncbi:hypothetical protein [Sphingobium aromaticiconvertens]|uniref:hypothetical protein n=1 Tax=Sphingobium aromaticiconvertens TaxID=365341 RepID=UPI00301A7AB1
MTRRENLAMALGGTLLAGHMAGCGEAMVGLPARQVQPPQWRRGFDRQRIADLGDGRFLNPLLSGDRLDPAILLRAL